MIAIIGAMESEIDGLKDILSEVKEEKRGGFTFYSGVSKGASKKEVLLLRCGVGKVFSAAAASMLLSNYNIDTLINIGVAGGISKKVKKLDIVVGTNAVQYDFDLSAVGLREGQLFKGHSGYFRCDPDISKQLYDIAVDHGFAHMGTIATGDRFVAKNSAAEYLAAGFDALACDMETAAIAQVAEIYGVRFASLRCISDGANNDAESDFDRFETAAANISKKVIEAYLKVNF